MYNDSFVTLFNADINGTEYLFLVNRFEGCVLATYHEIGVRKDFEWLTLDESQEAIETALEDFKESRDSVWSMDDDTLEDLEDLHEGEAVWKERLEAIRESLEA